MAKSTLTVRTLCLATVAFVLACGHAARAMGQQQKASQDRATPRVVPAPNKTIRVVPAGSGQSTIATITAKSSGSSRGSSSRVATFTNKSGSSSNSIATFSGDRIVRQTYQTSTARRPVPRRTISSHFARKGEPPVIVVRRESDPPTMPPLEPIIAALVPAPQTPATPQAPADAAPPAQAAAPAAQTAQPIAIRNAFAGLASPKLNAEPRRAPPILSIQASAAR